MQMLCPECLTPLISEDGKAANCPEHGGSFRVLYNRYEVSAPPPQETAAVVEASQPVETIDSPATEPAEEIAIPPAEELLADEPIAPLEEPELPEPARAETPIAEQQVSQPAEAIELTVEAELSPEPPELEIDPDVVEDLPATAPAEPETASLDPLTYFEEEEPPAIPTLEIEPPPAPAPISAATEPEAIVDLPDPAPAESPMLLDIPEIPAAEAAPEPVAESAPAAPPPVEVPALVLPAIPTPPPRPIRAKRPPPQPNPQPSAEVDQPILPRDAFDVPTPGIGPLPESVFAPGADLPLPQRRSGTGRAVKPVSRTGKGSLPPAPPLPPAPVAPAKIAPKPAPVAPAVAAAPRKSPEAYRAPTPQPKASSTRKGQELGRCAIHRDSAAVAICRTCGAGVCEKCDNVLPNNAHQCPKCFALARGSLNRLRTKTAKWSFGLACWSFLGLMLVITGATRMMFQTAGEFDGLALVLMMVWLFSPFVGLALAIFSYRRAEPNPRIVWISIMANAVLILAWIVPFVRILTHRQE